MALERISAVTFATGENESRVVVIDVAGDSLYSGLNTPPNIRITKVRLSDMTEIGPLTLTSSYNLAISCAVIDAAGGFAYFGNGGSGSIANIPFVHKVRLSDYTVVGSAVVNYFTPRSAVIDVVAGYAYFGGLTQVVRLKLSDMTTTSLTVSGAGYLTSAAIDTAGGFAYFGDDASPAEIYKIQLSDFTVVGSALVLNTGENNAVSAVMDATGGFAYFGLNLSPAKIVRIKLSDFTRDAVLTLNTGENLARAAVIDTGSGFAYFMTTTTPAIVVEVKLSDFTWNSALSLNTDENTALSGAIDTAGGFLYAGLGLNPGRIVKVKYKEVGGKISKGQPSQAQAHGVAPSVPSQARGRAPVAPDFGSDVVVNVFNGPVIVRR